MKLKLFLASLLFPIVAFGQATTGFHRQNQIISRAPSGSYAQVVPYATVYVTLSSTGAAATIYSDPLLSAPIPNSTVTTDKNGNYGYYIQTNYCVTENVSAPGQGNIVNANVCQNGGGGSGSISQINVGSGLTGGGNTSTVNVGIDTTIIPELGSSNSFTAAQNAPSWQVGGVTVLPSGLLGYHGSAASEVQLSDGTGTNGDCVKFGSGGVITDAGAPCGSGGSSGAFGSLTGGTNTTAAMIVGTGASLAATGSGTITATGLGGTPSISITNITGSGTVTFTGLESSSGYNCLQINSSGVISNTGGACGGSGGGSGTAGQLAWFQSTGTTTIGNSDITDSGGYINIFKPESISDGTGAGGYLSAGLGTAPTPSSSVDTLYASASTSRWMMNNINQGALYVLGLSAIGTVGDCLQFGSNGIDPVDSGTGCASAMGSTPGSVIADSGAGTSPTITTISGATDGAGWVQVLTGSSPNTSAGVVTIPFGGTYTKTPRCAVQPANAVASALSGNAAVYVPQSTSTTAHFVIQVGSTALAATTTYIWRWECTL